MVLIASSLLATFMSISLIAVSPGVQAKSPTSGLTYVAYYLIAALAFTAVVIFIGRRRFGNLLRWVFIAVIAYVTFYVWSILGLYIAQTYAEYYAISFAAPAIMVVLLIFKYEWYVVDVAGFFLSAGVASIWATIIGVWSSVLFLAVFAIYDYIAVYRTKHMISLAGTAMDSRLPMLFVFPSEKGTRMDGMSFPKTSAPPSERTGSGTFILGFGDIVFPCIMVASSALYGQQNLIPFLLLPLAGAIAGIMVLLFTKVSRPAPGLPFINSGAIAGFIVAFLAFRVF